MDVYVPTPNGAGRRVPPGKCVEGSFFMNISQGLKHMVSVPEGSVPETDIICKYNSITLNVMDTTEGLVTAPVVPNAVVLAETTNLAQTDTPALVPPTPEAVVTEPAPVVDETPKPKDLNKFNLTELKLAASGLGIEYDDTTTKRQLVNMLIAKDYKG